MAMNPLLAQLYNTHEKLASQAAQPVAAPASEEDEVNQFVFDELQKTASAQGIDLNQYTEEELQQVFEEYKAEMVKEASGAESVDAGAVSEADQEAIAAGDVMGRAAAHAFYHESNAIQEQMAMHEKLAGLSDADILDGLATQRAESILAALQGDGEGFMKEASMEITPDLEEVDDLITLRAAELLEEGGFDLEAICQALEG